ncbi:hypothetical protein OHB06_46755 [Streptomyces sp. NBC_01604]|uniref:hypothetical protein n=1 Tax=Streptomyces sp. NBC_01604 TaxID=2975894 RepID=UPI003863B995
MGTRLTAEVGGRFAVLLVVATGVTFALAAAFDAMALRFLRRRLHRTPTPIRAAWPEAGAGPAGTHERNLLGAR